MKESGKRVSLKIKVEPRSSRAAIVGPYGGSLKVKLCSPPVEGKANKELIELLSKELDIPKNDIQITSGHSSKNKVISLPASKETGKTIAALINNK